MHVQICTLLINFGLADKIYQPKERVILFYPLGSYYVYYARMRNIILFSLVHRVCHDYHKRLWREGNIPVASSSDPVIFCKTLNDRDCVGFPVQLVWDCNGLLGESVPSVLQVERSN